MSAASLTLGVIHLFAWVRNRSKYAHLLFFTLSASATAFGVFELAMMQAPSAAVHAATLRSAHVPLAIAVLSIVWFVRFHFDAGRFWLAWAACGFRLAALASNFLTGVNLNFSEVASLDQLKLLGGVVVVGPIGSPNPWAILAQISNLLLIAFVVDASVTLWRRGGPDARRRAAVVGGAVVVCVAGAGGFGALSTIGWLHAPSMVMPGVFVIVLAMGHELSWDLIASRQLSERLRASEMRFRAVVEAVPNAILVFEDSGVIVLANAQAEDMFGYTRAELVGSPVDRLLPERLRGPHAGRELVAFRKDGSEFPVEIAFSPMATEPGLFVLASVSDISQRRQMEQASALQRDELAHLSRVAMLGELSGSLAHELNQPLAAILSNAQAAQRFLSQTPPRMDQIPEILSDIVKSNHRARAVIQRLRSMLRKERAQHHLLDLNELVDESLRLMRSDLLNRNVIVETELAPALPVVIGDRHQLQQVLLNLMINGCDAMDTEQADRRLRLCTRRSAGGVEFSVADRGIGIPPSDLECIFNPFVTTKALGLGLGLTICRSIIESHGGQLWATNNAERGATLHCQLPGKRD